MAHLIEEIEGSAAMAYSGEVPWHGLGVKVPPDLTPAQMMKAAKLNWKVEKFEAFSVVDGETVSIGKSGLFRMSDRKLLDVVTDDWKPVQNVDAFAFFNDFVQAGDMEMHTAGSLQGGQVVWALAKVKENFSLFRGDVVESFLLFTNYHKYGYSTDVRFTPIRVVCNNTLTMSLSAQVDRMVKFTHRSEFNPIKAKEMLGIASKKLAEYKKMAQYLGSKKADNENIVEYFQRIFPVAAAPSKTAKKEVSKTALLLYDLLDEQPGSQYAPGTWWQALNAVTFFTDHMAGRSVNNRLHSSWYGANRTLKMKALELAVEYAGK